MDMQALQCPGCGSTNVTFDPKRRMLTCHQCYKEEYYSRATLNASGKVVHGKRNAMRFFTEGRMEDARHYAMDVLNISMDNAAAMFILAYYDEFTAKKPDSMKSFFWNIQDVALEYEEVQDMRTLLTAAAYNMLSFEEDAVRLISENMRSAEDTQELCGFIDGFSPYLISRRTSSGYLTENLAALYGELAQRCTIPKTCFALLKSLDTNPDSPYVDNSFYLRSKARYFYDHYVTKVGNVISKMRDPDLRGKFWGAYNTKCAKYREDAGITL